jgi:hypothetical protein
MVTTQTKQQQPTANPASLDALPNLKKLGAIPLFASFVALATASMGTGS